mmetsp:Transcript_75051/g.118597  ORF Transcript_75051/g.118597 Transcript_75051/m.118597 type:complete len:163 (-) Transcript_75051:293-781(-)
MRTYSSRCYLIICLLGGCSRYDAFRQTFDKLCPNCNIISNIEVHIQNKSSLDIEKIHEAAPEEWIQRPASGAEGASAQNGSLRNGSLAAKGDSISDQHGVAPLGSMLLSVVDQQTPTKHYQFHPVLKEVAVVFVILCIVLAICFKCDSLSGRSQSNAAAESS